MVNEFATCMAERLKEIIKERKNAAALFFNHRYWGSMASWLAICIGKNMIDTSKEYWTGTTENDIEEYLKLYSENDKLEVKHVVCHTCNENNFEVMVDQNEGAILIKCVKCKTEKILLDGEDVWENCEPIKGICPICYEKVYNICVGLERRQDGNVNWVYIGNRCTKCGVLGSFVDWKIDYEPTDEMENNF